MMANNSSLMEEEYYPLVKQPMHMIIIYSLAYSIIFLCALVGNVMVIAVVYRHPRMHTVTNYFIVNLAFADILVVIFCLPITLMANLFTGKCLCLYLSACY